MTQKSFAVTRYHLTDDEVIGMRLAGRTKESRFRLRIWRRAGSVPVVLVSQIEGQPTPSWATSRLANYVNQAYLGCGDCSYWECERPSCEPPRLYVIFFEPVGRRDRVRLIKPITKRKYPYDIAALVGQEVEL